MHDEESHSEGRGRTSSKRAVKAVEVLALRLVDLSDQDVRMLPLPDDLMRELNIARQTKGRGSRKRQAKYFTGKLRDQPETHGGLEAFLDNKRGQHQEDNQAFHHLEDLRARLCTADGLEDALAEIRAEFPRVDSEKLRRLASSAIETNDKKAFREIFKRLKAGAT